MTRTFVSGRPMAPDTNSRMKCGFWVAIQIVSWSSKRSYSAVTPRGSIGVGARRCWRMRSLTTTSAWSKAAFTESSGENVVSQARLSTSVVCTRGLPGSRAGKRSVTAGSGSYSTSIACAPSTASLRFCATTTATGSPWKTASSSAMGNRWGTVCFSGMKAGATGWVPLSSGLKSAAVRTATTPGIACAPVALIRLMRACGCGLRTIAIVSSPGRVRSSTYRPPPVIRWGSSRRWMRAPIIWLIAIPLGPPRGSGSRRGGAGGHGRARDLHGFDDVCVARAAAQVAFESLADLRLARPRVAFQQRGGRHDEAWRAEATLQPMLVPERFLERRQLAIRRQALDRRQLAAVGLDGEHRAGLDGSLVDQHGARPALAGIAADVRARQPEFLAQEVHQQVARLDLAGIRCPVDAHADRQSVSHKPSLDGCERTADAGRPRRSTTSDDMSTP